MADLVRHPLIDEILDANRHVAHGDAKGFEGYRSHAHRVHNFARAISSFTPEDEEKVAIAAAFHDLYVFDGLDYLEPSIVEAAGYLRASGREGWDEPVSLMIALHHRVRPYTGPHASLVEPFRRADWNDFTMGIVNAGIPRDVRKAANAEFPVGDFVPKALIRIGRGWLLRHPLRPAPPFRGEAALRRTGRDRERPGRDSNPRPNG
jgi:hypothetical protein